MKLSSPLVLASSSPRRHYLMKAAGFQFRIEKPDVEEHFPADLPVQQVARYLASLKAEYFRPSLRDEILVTADTVVILGNEILNKPRDHGDAMRMLRALSGATHVVMTGVCIVSPEKEESFDETTAVTFHRLSESEIRQYVDHFKPFDKAGAYGAQDCLPPGVNPCAPEELAFLSEIGKEGLMEETVTRHHEPNITIIKKISGSYFNVMGLPVHKVHAHLKSWNNG